MNCDYCGEEVDKEQTKKTLLAKVILLFLSKKKAKYRTCNTCYKFMSDVAQHNVVVARTQFKKNREVFYSSFKGQDDVPFVMPQINFDMIEHMFSENNKEKKKIGRKDNPTYIG